jgi:hypothetical protein
MTVAWAPPLRFRRCPNGSATRRDSSRSNDQRVRGILRDSGWNAIELRPLDIACAMPQRKLVGYDRSGRRSAQNADKRTRAQGARRRGPLYRRVLDGDGSANDVESRSYAGYRGAVPPALCSKLCSDRDASRHIGRHRTELRLRDIDRKSRVLACFVTA